MSAARNQAWVSRTGSRPSGYAEAEAINQQARQPRGAGADLRAAEHGCRPGDRPGLPDLPAAASEYILGRIMADLYPKELNWEQEYAIDPFQRAPQGAGLRGRSAAAWR